MVTNNEAVENFLNGKRNLAAYQFSQLIKETTFPSADAANTTNPGDMQHLNSDEIALNYAMVNLFTGCPQRASIIFSDLVKRYPRNPRLWLRLAESMLAAERAKMSEFEHVQQLVHPHTRDHLIKTKNKPILIKINPNYCQQQIQQYQTQRGAPSNFLVTIKGYLEKSLDLINEYNDISFITDDTAINSTTSNLQQKQQQQQQQQKNQTITGSALYHLRNKVQLNLAYICLCMGEPVKALNYTTQCLKSSPLGYEKVLANLYHAEACVLASRIDEAIQFLNFEVLNMAKSLSQEHPLVIGDTKRVVYSDEMQRQIDSGALATVVNYNLSVAYAAKGEFDTAQKILTRTLQPTKPSPMQIIICLLYIQLQQGQLESAKKTILSNLPQFR